jgi:hypothetical protein
MNFFTCVDDYISKEQCAAYIEHYENNIQHAYDYDNSLPLKIKADAVIESIVQNFGIRDNLDNLEIVKRVAPSKMDNHYDQGDSVAFILYLNDTFVGGETVIENQTTIFPTPGRILVFSNGTLLHKVNEITEGSRYVIAGWFK